MESRTKRRLTPESLDALLRDSSGTGCRLEHELTDGWFNTPTGTRLSPPSSRTTSPSAAGCSPTPTPTPSPGSGRWDSDDSHEHRHLDIRPHPPAT
ncbi:hypothetical protein ACFVSN_06365 [Kitasatospora sp. NPDC057904]|uniref:hypothetical protein n=1 Tax=unclassified Kitasatospora TaxID=2633591 RepID=UPI0036D7A687